MASVYIHRDGQSHSPTRTTETHMRDDVLSLDQRHGDVAPLGSGFGTRAVSVPHRYWWTTHDLTAWLNGWDGGGDANAAAHVIEQSLDWNRPSRYTVPSLPEALWQDFAASPQAQWIGEHWGDVPRVAGGAFDLGLGVGASLGSGGLAILPGVGLMAVGIDPMYAGAAAIVTGQRGPSVIEFLGYAAARGLGAGEGAAQVVGALTPAALSLVFSFGVGILGATEGAEDAARAAREEREMIREMQATVDANLARIDAVKGGAAGPALIHLTNDAGMAGIGASGQIIGRQGIFAVPASVADESGLWKALRTGIWPSNTANAIPIPEAAAVLFGGAYWYASATER